MSDDKSGMQPSQLLMLPAAPRLIIQTIMRSQGITHDELLEAVAKLPEEDQITATECEAIINGLVAIGNVTVQDDGDIRRYQVKMKHNRKRRTTDVLNTLDKLDFDD